MESKISLVEKLQSLNFYDKFYQFVELQKKEALELHDMKELNDFLTIAYKVRTKTGDIFVYVYYNLLKVNETNTFVYNINYTSEFYKELM